MNHAIEFSVEEDAAVEYTTCFRKEEPRILQIELPKNFLNLFAQVIGRRGQKCPRESFARFSSLRYDGEYSRESDSRLVAHQIYKLIPGAGKSAANFLSQYKRLLVQEFLKAKRRGFSSYVVGAAWVTNNWPKTPSPGKLHGLRSSQNGGASTGNNHDTGNFSRCAQCKDQITGDSNRSIGKSRLQTPFDSKASLRLSCSGDARHDVGHFFGSFRNGMKSLQARLGQRGGRSFGTDVDGIGRTGAGARENRSVLVHQNTFGLCAATVKTKDIAHKKSINENNVILR